MRVLLQRASSATVSVDGDATGSIGSGLVLLVGVAATDGSAIVQPLVHKIAHLRIFEDTEDRMNLSAIDLLSAGEDIGMLVVSQFTLFGDMRKGRRPSFSRAAGAELAAPLVEAVADEFRALGFRVGQGVFGAHMQVTLVNDGPVTIWIDSDDLGQPRRDSDG